MLRKHTLVLALLVPLATLAACNRHDADDAAADNAAPAAAATVMPPAPAAMPAEMPAGDMASMPAAETPFADLDKNHDGSLTKDELPDGEMLKDHFSKADTNGDGKLSEAEAAKHRAAMAAEAPKP